MRRVYRTWWWIVERWCCLCGDAGGARIHVHATVSAREAAQRHAAVRGQLDRERARGADADEDRGAGDGGLLHELERQAAAHAEDAVVQRQQPVEQGAADDLVHRVVAADVLAYEQQ